MIKHIFVYIDIFAHLLCKLNIFLSNKSRTSHLTDDTHYNFSHKKNACTKNTIEKFRSSTKVCAFYSIINIGTMFLNKFFNEKYNILERICVGAVLNGSRAPKKNLNLNEDILNSCFICKISHIESTQVQCAPCNHHQIKFKSVA